MPTARRYKFANTEPIRKLWRPSLSARNWKLSTRKMPLKPPAKTYTFDSAELDAYSTGFTPRNCAEYSFAGKKYVRIEGKPYDSDSILSDGTSVQKGQAYWFEVQPIEWLMDPKGTWVRQTGAVRRHSV